jgi:tRNA isopentenyl-2-thiomethyl-A-37 hydroxylase MiaE
MGKTKNKEEEKEKSVVAQGFIDIKSYEEIAEFAERRGEIIATLQQRIAGYEADIKGLQDKLKFCESNDQRIVDTVVETLSKLESGLLHGLKDLGEITAEDVSYNMNLVKRIITKKHGRK